MTIVDVRGIRHSVEVQADTLFAAATAALSAFRDADWTDKVGPGTTLHIEVQAAVVRHTVTLQQLRRWTEGVSLSPEERLRKEQLRTVFGEASDGQPMGR